MKVGIPAVSHCQFLCQQFSSFRVSGVFSLSVQSLRVSGEFHLFLKMKCMSMPFTLSIFDVVADLFKGFVDKI